ncbi:hypothetical protein HYE68_008966 [Fusarium pseudograminearum]|nr:hypothetical protein HYE68_008966 [Fusarium pseudograminearum]
MSPVQYIILANEMGTGKTKTFASIKMRHNPLKQQLDELNGDPEFDKLSPEGKIESGRSTGFRSHLCLGPVATIIQTVRESVDNFPDFRNLVFYSTASVFPIRGIGFPSSITLFEHYDSNVLTRVFPIKVGVEVNEKSRIHSTIGKFQNPESLLDPDSGLVFSKYTTLSKRWMPKEEKPFRWRDGEGTLSTSKKTKRYQAKEVNEQDIVMLPEDSQDEAHGVLVTYYPDSSLIPDHHFDMLICDEAQYIRHVTGSSSCSNKTDITSEFGEKLGQTVGIFSEAFVAKHQENSEVTDALHFFKMAHDGWSLKPWMLSPNLLVDSSKELSWGVNLGSKVVKPLLKSFYIRRTMKTALTT